MSMTAKIRNFSIIAHIDHGKSTLADRLLERTGTIEARKMRDQVLDKMDLERERGITIKMQPARMKFKAADGGEYVLNLIDTPGHIDFAYEVSRALSAVEGVILLVDSTQGIQAQTLTTLQMARDAGCVVIPVLSKIDAPAARPDDVALELAELLSVDPDTVLKVSGRTGEGVEELLEAIVDRVPAPREGGKEPRALIFDFSYSTHRGITVFMRVFDGSFKKGDVLRFAAAGERFTALETGIFMPDELQTDSPFRRRDRLSRHGREGSRNRERRRYGHFQSGLYGGPGRLLEAAPGGVGFVYPESQDDLPELRQALERLRLSDSSLSFEEESSACSGAASAAASSACSISRSSRSA